MLSNRPGISSACSPQSAYAFEFAPSFKIRAAGRGQGAQSDPPSAAAAPFARHGGVISPLMSHRSSQLCPSSPQEDLPFDQAAVAIEPSDRLHLFVRQPARPLAASQIAG